MAKEKKRNFNDLLLPIMFILSIFPFITRLLIYYCELSKYSWFPKAGITSDFFTYYKGFSLIILAVLCLCILPFSIISAKKQIKPIKQLIPLLLYFIFVLLSTIFSSYHRTSMSGTNGHFEGFYVLLAYIILFLYSYFITDMKQDIRFIIGSLVVSSIGLCLYGFLQIFVQDPIQWNFVQKLIMNANDYKDYAGSLRTFFTTKAISLTLANPNYASTYIAMLISFFTVYLIGIKDKKKKVGLILLLLSLFSILFMTLSRGGLLAVFVSFILLCIILRKELIHHKKGIIISILVILGTFALFDILNSFQYTKKIVATMHSFQGPNEEEPLEQIITGDNAITLTYNRKSLNISFDNTTTQNKLHFEDGNQISYDKLYNEKTGVLDVSPFETLRFQLSAKENGNYINITIDDSVWPFTYISKEGYYYYNYFERLEKLGKIPTIGFKGHENIASNRAYIWSRTLPLLKHSIFIGSGPDTFPIVFPQNDRVGKLYNCKYVYSIVEKAHSLYLQIATQTGVLSLLAFLSLYGIYLIQSFRCLKNFSTDSKLQLFGLACLLLTVSYMTSGFFNDSVIQTSPLFYIMLGLGFSTNIELLKVNSCTRG